MDQAAVDTSRLKRSQTAIPGPVGVAVSKNKEASKKVSQKPVDPFLGLCRSAGLPQPQPEYRFAPPRRWRFDYAWPDRLIALEVEGGIWTNGRHTRAAGFLDDMEKYNAAAAAGWRVFRTTPDALPLMLVYLRPILT